MAGVWKRMEEKNEWSPRVSVGVLAAAECG
jgi:hypothetical protein